MGNVKFYILDSVFLDMKKIVKIVGFIGVFILFFISFTSAFGVATFYSDNYPLRMKPGEIKDTFFLLRNVVEGDSDVIIKAELISGNEIAKITDETNEYDLPFGEEKEVNIRIEIPKDAAVGSIYRINAIFRPVSSKGGAGNVQFVLNIGKSFPIIITGETLKLQADKEEGAFTFTIEDEQNFVEDLAPPVGKGRFVWAGLVFFFIAGIVIVSILVVYLIIRNKGEEVELNQRFIRPERIERFD